MKEKVEEFTASVLAGWMAGMMFGVGIGGTETWGRVGSAVYIVIMIWSCIQRWKEESKEERKTNQPGTRNN